MLSDTDSYKNAAGTPEAPAGAGTENAGTVENAVENGAVENAGTIENTTTENTAAENAGTVENTGAANADEPGAPEAPADAGNEPSLDFDRLMTEAAGQTGPVEKAPAPRAKNRGRLWGILIGAALGLLACACVVLGAATLAGLNGGRGAENTPAVKPAGESALTIQKVPENEEGYATPYIVKEVQDSVVGVLIYGSSSLTPTGSATGIIMTEDGYIITNAHVVRDASSLSVVLADDTKYNASVVGYDEKTDLAVVKINASGLQPATFGDSEAVNVGERAIAIGNPGGLSNSVTQGIISATGRDITIELSDGSYSTITVLQTDAAINPGNSGGPLVNAYGQVIGINSSKIVSTGYEGIGFAIPITEAQPIIDNLMQYGYVKDRAVLGITVIALDASTGPANGLPSQGLYISEVKDYSDLKNYGIAGGDVILKANGTEMKTVDDLTGLLLTLRPGDTVQLEIYKAYDGSTVTLDVLLLDSKAAG